MKIIIPRNIVTIIFTLSLPILVSTRISLKERSYEFRKQNFLKTKATDVYIDKVDKSKAWDLLNKFVLNENEMKEFLQYFNTNGIPPEWSNGRKLMNPIHYKNLRYYFNVESSSFSIKRAIKSVKNLKLIFKNTPEVSTSYLFKSYVDKNLLEILTFEDYYTLKIYMTDISQIALLDNPVGWRIKRALYSLAIRQYSPYLSSSDNVNYSKCFFTAFEKKEIIDNIQVHGTLSGGNFVLCKSIFNKVRLDSSEFESTSYLVSYKVLFSKAIYIVNLNDIFDDNQEVNIILPEINYMLRNKKSAFSIDGLSYERLSIEIVNKLEDSEWLSYLANSIEVLKQKEREYFENV